MVEDGLAKLRVFLHSHLQHTLGIIHPVERAQLHGHRNAQMREVRPAIRRELINRQRRSTGHARLKPLFGELVILQFVTAKTSE